MNCLVRYGAVSEVAKFACEESVPRGADVVIETHRGLQLGTALETLRADTETDFRVVRVANESDRTASAQRRDDADAAFFDWSQRIAEWELALELVDLEWTLDGEKLILYVLTERGPDATKLALQAAAAGLGLIEVQPVSRDGLVQLPAESGGCGTGGCGCHD